MSELNSTMNFTLYDSILAPSPQGVSPQWEREGFFWLRIHIHTTVVCTLYMDSTVVCMCVRRVKFPSLGLTPWVGVLEKSHRVNSSLNSNVLSDLGVRVF